MDLAKIWTSKLKMVYFSVVERFRALTRNPEVLSSSPLLAGLAGVNPVGVF